MKNTGQSFQISVHTISGILGLIVCYSLSIYFFWESQAILSDFKLDPENSRFAKGLYIFMSRDNAKIMGTMVAFIALHLSWSFRYYPGLLLERVKDGVLLNRSNKS